MLKALKQIANELVVTTNTYHLEDAQDIYSKTTIVI